MREEPNWDAPRQCMVSQLSAYSKSSFTAPDKLSWVRDKLLAAISLRKN